MVNADLCVVHGLSSRPEGRWLVRKTHPHIHKLLFPAYIVIGRKNWLFHGNDKGARAGAILYSLIETCKAHQVDIFAWLKHALTLYASSDTLEKMKALLPFNVKPEDLEAARAIPELIYPEKMKWTRPIYQTASIMRHN